MEALFELEPTVVQSAAVAGAKSRRSMQRNGLRYGPAENDIRATPSALFRQLAAEFDFTLDVCANDLNAKCERYFSEADNGLAQTWAPERCWMNPPYSDIEPWTRKAVSEQQGGALIVGLLPVRTDLAWFHRDVLVADAEIRFLRGRMRFEHGNGLPMWATAPHPSMLVVWWPKSDPPEAPSGRSRSCARCGASAVMWSGAWVLEDGWIGWCSKTCQNAWLRGDKSAGATDRPGATGTTASASDGALLHDQLLEAGEAQPSHPVLTDSAGAVDATPESGDEGSSRPAPAEIHKESPVGGGFETGCVICNEAWPCRASKEGAHA